MVSVNLIFHVVSGLTFTLLIWYLLHLQAQLTFLRMLINSLSQETPKVVVDWPPIFLRKFAAAQGLPYRLANARSDVDHAAKIDVKLWAEAHAALGIESVESAAGLVRLKVRQKKNLQTWGSRLESSLQGKIKIEWI